jgi:undecaprenyl-diphosphatase
MSFFIYSQDKIAFKLDNSIKTYQKGNRKSDSVIIIDGVNIDKHNHSKIEYGKSPNHYRLNVKKDPDNWDVRLFRSINNNRNPFKDRFFDTFDRSMLPVSILLPVSQFIYGRAYDKTYDENSAYLLFGAEITNGLLTFGTKLFVKRERPLNALPNCYCKSKPILDVYSFPSGHSSTSFTIATMYTLRYSKYPQVYLPMYAWAVIVAYGRPYFGMHYPTDLIAGALYGAGSSLLIYSLRKELFKFKNNLLNEDKDDDGSIKGGTVSFFVGSFLASSFVNNFIIKPTPGKRLFVSPWVNEKGGGLNINYGF